MILHLFIQIKMLIEVIHPPDKKYENDIEIHKEFLLSCIDGDLDRIKSLDKYVFPTDICIDGAGLFLKNLMDNKIDIKVSQMYQVDNLIYGLILIKRNTMLITKY